MAKCEVVHTDIRAGWEKTYNILYRVNGPGIDLCLIDYDSLSQYPFDAPGNGRCISMKYLRSRNTTAFTFVWWQVLLMAYVWKCQISNEIFDSHCFFADKLMKSLFSKNGKHIQFKEFVKDKWERLEYLSQCCDDLEAVEELLEILTSAFEQQARLENAIKNRRILR